MYHRRRRMLMIHAFKDKQTRMQNRCEQDLSALIANFRLMELIRINKVEMYENETNGQQKMSWKIQWAMSVDEV